MLHCSANVCHRGSHQLCCRIVLWQLLWLPTTGDPGIAGGHPEHDICGTQKTANKDIHGRFFSGSARNQNIATKDPCSSLYREMQAGLIEVFAVTKMPLKLSTIGIWPSH